LRAVGVLVMVVVGMGVVEGEVGDEAEADPPHAAVVPRQMTARQTCRRKRSDRINTVVSLLDPFYATTHSFRPSSAVGARSSLSAPAESPLDPNADSNALRASPSSISRTSSRC